MLVRFFLGNLSPPIVVPFRGIWYSEPPSDRLKCFTFLREAWTIDHTLSYVGVVLQIASTWIGILVAVFLDFVAGIKYSPFEHLKL